MVEIESIVYRVKGRDIIKVQVREGYVQPFYRSTGRNSSMPGQWLPFSGVVYVPSFEGNGIEIPIWLDKAKFSDRLENGLYGELHRYGTQELKEVSKILGMMNIPEGVETKPSIVNEWLGYNHATAMAEYEGSKQ